MQNTATTGFGGFGAKPTTGFGAQPAAGETRVLVYY